MPLPRKPFEERLHPRGFGGKFGHGTGTAQVHTPKPRVAGRPQLPGAAKPPVKPVAKAKPIVAGRHRAPKKYTAKDVTSGSALKKRPGVAAQKASFWEKAGIKPRVAGKDGPKPIAKPKPKAGKPIGYNTPERAAPRAQRAVTPEGARFKMLSIGRQPDGSMDYEVRGKYVDEKLTAWRKEGPGKLDTEIMYRQPNGEWKPERLAQQEQLLEDIWYAHAQQVPNQGRAIFSGGLGGAGKGVALRDAGIDTDADWEHPGKNHEFLTINPDVIKAMMAQRGMLPLDADPNLTPMELSPLAHEEASEMAERLAKRAYMERKNVIWDFTMASEKSVVAKRLVPMRAAGYKNVTAVFVDTTFENSRAQADKRWQRGMNDFIGGKGDGGRFLPSGASLENQATDGSGYNSKNREVFEAVKHHFDGYLVKQNLGKKDAQGKPVEMTKLEEVGSTLGGKGLSRKERNSDALDVDAMVAALGDRFSKASQEMRDTGADWYPAGGEWVEQAVAGTDYTPAQGAAIVAAFSPNTGWDRNLILALNYIKGRPLGEDDGKGTLVKNIERADRVRDMVNWDGTPVPRNKDGSLGDPITVLTGKDKAKYKVTNFYRNLTGNQEAVTVDRWAIRAALGVDDATAVKIAGWAGAYEKIGDAYRKAAHDAGITPAAMQAIVWGQIRGSFV